MLRIFRHEHISLTLLLFTGCRLTFVSNTNLYLFPSTVCPLILHSTSPALIPFTPLPISFTSLLTALLSSIFHLSVHYPMVKGLSHTPPLLLGILFLSRSALLIMSLLSDPDLKLTSSGLPIDSLNISIVICVSRPFSVVLLMSVCCEICQYFVIVFFFNCKRSFCEIA